MCVMAEVYIHEEGRIYISIGLHLGIIQRVLNTARHEIGNVSQ